MLVNALWIGLWAWLYVNYLSQRGEVFWPLREFLSDFCMPAHPFIFKIVVDCAKCHAGQIAAWYQLWLFLNNEPVSVPFILVAIAVPVVLEKWRG